MRTIIRIWIPIVCIGLLLVGCREANPRQLTIPHENIRFIIIHIKKYPRTQTINDPAHISAMITAIERATRTDEILNPFNGPGHTPDEDGYMDVVYDSSQKLLQKSFSVWLDKEKQTVKLAPLQKGTTYLYLLDSETAKEVIKLVESG